MTGDTTYSGDDSKDTINELAAAIAAKFGTATVTKNVDSKAITKYEVTSSVVATNTDLDTKFSIDDIEITWAWAYEATADTVTTEDMADTILGLLMNRSTADSNNTTIDGTVVKATTTGEGDSAVTTWAAPTPYEDYCLDTMIDIEITVEQVD